MTYQDAAQDAITCQDACNLSGVARSLVEALDAIWEQARAQGKGTDYVNTHPIVSLFLHKLTDLNRLDSREYSEVFRAVKQITEGRETQS